MDGKTLEKINVLLVGNGKWAQNYSDAVQAHSLCKIADHISARKLIHDLESDKAIFANILKKNKIQIIIIATLPYFQRIILENLEGFKGQLILEKPLFNNKIDYKFYRDLPSSLKNKIIVNHFHFFSDSYLKLLNFVKDSHIQKLYIRDYGNGPYRDFISPLLDWGPHAIGLCHHLNSSLKIKNTTKLKNGDAHKWYIKLEGNTIKDIRILTGNGFSKKKRFSQFFQTPKQVYKYDVLDSLEEVSPMSKLITASIDRLKENEIHWSELHHTFDIASKTAKTLIDIESAH